MTFVNSYFLACPYCLEQIEVCIDTSAGSQVYMEDCEVCCHPIQFRIMMDGNEVTDIEASRENE